MVNKGPTSLDRLFKMSAKFGPSMSIFAMPLPPQTLGLVKTSENIIKEQLAKICVSLSIPWTEALPLVFLSLRSSPTGQPIMPFGNYHWVPMRLEEGLHQPVWLKGDPLHYCKKLISILQGDAELVKDSFRRMLVGDEGS